MRVKMHPKGNKKSITEVDESQVKYLQNKGFVILDEVKKQTTKESKINK